MTLWPPLYFSPMHEHPFFPHGKKTSHIVLTGDAVRPSQERPHAPGPATGDRAGAGKSAFQKENPSRIVRTRQL